MTALQSTTRSELIPLSKIEQELSHQLGAAKDPGEAPVRRAHMSNLVIYCGSDEQAATIGQAVPQIVAAHPARVLLLIGDSSRRDSPKVLGSVNVWTRGDGQQKVCSEQVTLRAEGMEIDNLPFAVRGLLIGDLPTNVWWAAPVPPPLAGTLLHDLSDRAQQIIYDSIGWAEPIRGVVATASWLGQFQSPTRGSWRVASDINFRRLKFWRRLMAQALDPATAPGALNTVSEVLVEHGPHAVVQAMELVGWLMARMGWIVVAGKVRPGVDIVWRVSAGHGDITIRLQRLAEGHAEVQRVRVACQLDGRASALNFTIEDNQRLAVMLEGTATAARTVTLQHHSLADLVGRQLSDRNFDPVFRDSMQAAQTLAHAVLV